MRLVLAIAVAATLGGCALMGGGKPAFLYRFGDDMAAGAPTGQRVTVQLNSLIFQQAAEGDRILTVTGAQAAYLKDSRWVSNARELFTRAAEQAFDRAGVRLTRRVQSLEPDMGVALEVPTFEARYENGPKAPPVVVVEVRAAMVRGRERDVVGETAFVARQAAADNRVGAIVQAFDEATREALQQTAQWAAAQARSAPPT